MFHFFPISNFARFQVNKVQGQEITFADSSFSLIRFEIFCTTLQTIRRKMTCSTRICALCFRSFVFSLIFRVLKQSVQKTQIFFPTAPTLWSIGQCCISFERKCFTLSKFVLHLFAGADFCQLLAVYRRHNSLPTAPTLWSIFKT